MFSILFLQKLYDGQKTTEHELVLRDIAKCNRKMIGALGRNEMHTTCKSSYIDELMKHYQEHEPYLTVSKCSNDLLVKVNFKYIKMSPIRAGIWTSMDSYRK